MGFPDRIVRGKKPEHGVVYRFYCNQHVYLSQWVHLIAENADEVAPEVAIKIGDGSNPHGSRSNLPIRIDAFVREDDGPSPIATRNTPLQLDAMSFSVAAGPEITLEGFAWDHCDILFDGPTEWDTIVKEWFWPWFNFDEERDPDPLGGVIHELCEPQSLDGKTHLVVDFGSAESDAFIQLMRLLAKLGARDIWVGTLGDDRETPTPGIKALTEFGAQVV